MMQVHMNTSLYRWYWLRPLLLIASDAAAILSVCAAANGLLFATVREILISGPIAVAGVVLFVFLAELSGLYHESLFVPGLVPPPHEELRRLFHIIAGLLVVRFFYFQEFPHILLKIRGSAAFEPLLKAGLVFGLLPLFFLAVILFRWTVRMLMEKSGVGISPVVILGAGEIGDIVSRMLQRSKHFGLKPVAFFDDDPQKKGRFVNGVPVIGTLQEYLEEEVYRLCFVPYICLPLPLLQTWGERLFFLNRRAYIASLEDYFPSSSAVIHDQHGLTVLGLKNNLNIRHNLRLQRFINVVLAGLALLVFAVPMLIIALLVRLTSKGPVLYFANRLGQGGRTIAIPKFRTMHKDADQRLEEMLECSPELRREWERNFKLKNDPRITPVGGFLRRTSLDELPQLISVLKGDLNLAGPRPIVEGEIKLFGKGYDLISRVKPGLTGMWQVSGRSSTTYGERVFLETYYIRNWSIWLDFYILFKTVLEVALCRGAY
jgi:Undecaprenyl-phosphate galactose phosphotransferase WbaP